jgi:hypothetical protein
VQACGLADQHDSRERREVLDRVAVRAVGPIDPVGKGDVGATL